MTLLTSEEFKKKYGNIVGYTSIVSSIKKIFVVTSNGAWVFLDAPSSNIFMYCENYSRSQASPRRCTCGERICHKCHINNSYYTLKCTLKKPYNVYSYKEIYKDFIKNHSIDKIMSFKKTLMDFTDEQF